MGTYSNFNKKSSTMIFYFSVFCTKNSFGENLVLKLQIVCFKWYLVPRIIRISTLQCWCLFFLFLTGDTFLTNSVPKFKNLKWNLVPTLIPIYTIHWWFFFSLFMIRTIFCANLVKKKIKIVSLSENLVLALISIWRVQLWFSPFLFS